MLKITSNEKNLPEKRYIFDIIFNEYLGLDYQLIVDSNCHNYMITLPNNNQIVIEDHFWSRIKKDELEYLSEDFLPKKIKYSINQFTFEKDLPVLYGEPEVFIESNKVQCRNDIFAAVYFFLTRWEEHISRDRDFADRFKYKNSISAKFNLIDRPIVNEIVEFIWNTLIFYGYNGKRKKHLYKSVITHDIDQPIRLENFKMLVKDFGKNLFRLKSVYGSASSFLVYVYNKISPKYDLGNTYDFLMDISESIGEKSYFNFQSTKKTDFDWGYDIHSPFIKTIFEKIKNRGHIIGYHPGYFTLDDPELWRKDYQTLCSAADFKVLSGRQHYLKFKAPDTWQIWENNGLEIDTTLGFAEREGFRCGTCWEYSVYNFLSRKKLNLKEMPLILMEVSLINYQNITNAEIFFNIYDDTIQKVKRYNGSFVFLWHNSAFDRTLYTKEFYRALLKRM